MAALPQQTNTTAIPRTSTEAANPAQAMWDQWMKSAPIIAGILSVLGSIIEFFIGGHVFVAIGHKLIKTAGRIAETALLFATLWITAVNVAPDLVDKLGEQKVANLNDLSMITFSLLPEIIVFSAIIISYQHWSFFFRDRRKTNPAWVWAVLYSIPTLSFIIMTIVTISSFVSAHGSGAVHATGLALVIRCLSGWFFGVIELLYASLGKNSQQTFSPQQVIDQMAAVVATTTATFDRAIENTVAAITARTQQQLSSQIASVQFQITQKVASEVATFEEAIEQKVANLISQIQIAPPSITTQGITDEQFNLLVELINQQATTIQQLSSSLAEVRREVRTTVTEIRSFTQETTAIQAPASTKALPASRTVESDIAEGTEADKRGSSIEKPGQRVQRFLQECQARNYKPTLQEIQDICQVAKKTATTYRQNFYGEGGSSQTEEEE